MGEGTAAEVVAPPMLIVMEAPEPLRRGLESPAGAPAPKLPSSPSALDEALRDWPREDPAEASGGADAFTAAAAWFEGGGRLPKPSSSSSRKGLCPARSDMTAERRVGVCRAKRSPRRIRPTSAKLACPRRFEFFEAADGGL